MHAFCNNNKIRHFQHSQLLGNDIHDILYDYISHKNAQKTRFNKILHSIGYKPFHNSNNTTFRYEDDLALGILDRNYRERRCITRLRNKQTIIERYHLHFHNNKMQIVEYHVKDHNLTKFLCNFLGLPYKSRIYLPHGHLLATDSSGFDVCHITCLQQLLDKSIETDKEGIELLKLTFLHGKLMVCGEVKFEW